MMLRRLARSEDIGSLRTLASILEPVKEYRRYDMRPQTMLSPLTGLIDATRPDSAAARRFGSMVDQLLNDAPRFQLYHQQIRSSLDLWHDSGIALEPTIDRAAGLEEIRPLAKDLSDLARIGLEALAYLESGVTPPTGWREAKIVRLDEAAKPKAALEFVVISSLKKLVIGASEPRTTTMADWKKRVMSLLEATNKQ
jgi:hexosaminidase